MYDPTCIKPPSPEGEEAGRLYREALALAKAGRFDEAIRSAEAIEETGFRLRLIFRNEALLGIVAYCCEAGQIDKASDIAAKMDAPALQKRAYEIIGSHARKNT